MPDITKDLAEGPFREFIAPSNHEGVADKIWIVDQYGNSFLEVTYANLKNLEFVLERLNLL